MNPKQRIRVAGVLLFFFFFSLSSVSAKEVQHVESEGMIGFTGTYVPIGTPDPPPPVTEIAKSEGSLPQTNTRQSNGLVWLGFLILSFVFFRWKQNNLTQTKTNK